MAIEGASFKLFCGAVSHETNSFSPIPTSIENFKSNMMIYRGALGPSDTKDWPEPLQGFREEAAELGWTIDQGLCASATPSGPCNRADYEILRDTLIADLSAAMPVDAVALCLHGAMMAHGYPDCEGDIIAHVRRIVGPDIPIGVVLDPHAHLSATMVEQATLLIFFKEYPHTDVKASARAVVSLLARSLRGEVTPVASLYNPQMISMYFTDKPPMRDFVDAMIKAETRSEILSVSLVHGFPWGDTPDMGSRMLVYSDNDSEAGDALASRFGQQLYELRHETAYELPDAGEFVSTLNVGGGPIVLADAADNPGGGAPGDNTTLIHCLLKQGIENIVVAPFWDPCAVADAFAHGEGASVLFRVGGKVSAFSGLPIDREFEVVRLVERAEQVVENWHWPMGRTALLRSGGLEIVVTSERLQAINTDVFTCVGVDLEAKDVIVVKSAQHFVPAFEPIAREIHQLAAEDGLLRFGDANRYKNLIRPMWPFDTILLAGSLGDCQIQPQKKLNN
ncbi:MAG: microcystin LR degradation protein MlrC-like protein [Robiginitomaculum sp.]|nr:MAG: microcystin LR degradation protein MlrC-like protein [Robiginitomaculum sp.]